MPIDTNKQTGTIIVFDIDGVLSDGRHREHYLESSPKDWVSFFAMLTDDAPITSGIDRLMQMLPLKRCVLLSGRPEHTRAATTAWLHNSGVSDVPIYLRRNHDYRPASLFKLEVLAGLGGPQEVGLVIDDDEQVVAALTAAGYRVEHFTA
jgi:hypothetical protein